MGRRLLVCSKEALRLGRRDGGCSLPLRPLVRRMMTATRLLEPNGVVTAGGTVASFCGCSLLGTRYGRFYTMGRFRTSASEGRLPPGQCVNSGWTGLASLFFDSNADSNETGRFKWPLVPTMCLNRKRAKYPPFPASHYGRLFRLLYRGIRGGLPLLGLLSLCPLCRRFTRRVVGVCPPSRLPAGCCSCRI